MATIQAGRKRLILVLAVIVLGAVVAGVYTLKQAQTKRDMARWLEEGTAAYERGEYPEALGLLSNYVARDKTNVKALLDFADTHTRIPLDDGRHIAQARGIVQTALALEPDSLRGRTMLMELYSAAGLWTEARDAAERVLQLDESNLFAHETRLNAFVVTDRREEIISAATRMAGAVPDDLDVQRLAFRAMLVADADDQILDGFFADCENRFSGRLGLELMRAEHLDTRIRQRVPGSPDTLALGAQFDATMLRASKLPAVTTAEARDLVVYLDQMGTDGKQLSQEALERFLENPDLSAGLASFAAERYWSRGLFGDAGTVVLTHTPDLAEATNDTLGWLALSGLAEAAKAQEILRTRTTPDAEVWIALSEASRYLASGDTQAADQVIPNTLLRHRAHETIARYLQGKVQYENGEIAKASQTWRQLLDISPNWSIARWSLAKAYLNLNRPLEAFDLLRRDRGTDALYLRVLIALDENGLAYPQRTTRNSYEMSAPKVEQFSENIEFLCLAARAAIATGHMTEARQYTDMILGLQPGQASRDVAVLADKLDRSDPERASALRESLASVATDPATVLMLAVADATNGKSERGIARLQTHLDKAQDTDKLEWELALAHYRDLLGDPEAAARLLELSKLHPTNLRVQQHVLQAESVWKDPASLGPVVQRLHEIAGNTSPQWRLYNNKRKLVLIDPESDRAVELATNIMFDLVALTRDEPNNIEALSVFAAAAEIAGDTTRAAEYLLRAVRADPSNITRRLKLINVAFPRAGRVEEARQHAEALAQYTIEGNPALLRERAVTFERFGLNNLARADWERLAMADDPTAKIHMASILAASGNLDEADALIEAVLAEDSIPDTALNDAANYLAGRGDTQRGLALLERLPEDGELGPRDKLIARYLFIRTDTVEQARALETRAQAEDTPIMWAAAVNGYMGLGFFDDAQRIVSTALTSHPNATELLLFNQLLEARAANDPLAFLILLRSRRSFTNTPESARIVMLLDQRLGNQIDDARLIENLQELVEQSPSSFEPREALATAQRVADQLDDMADTLRAAMDAFPATPRVAEFATIQFRSIGATDHAISAARQWRTRLGSPHLGADQALASLLLSRGRASEALAVLEPWRTMFIRNRAEQPGDAFLLASTLAGSGQTEAAKDILSPLAGLPGPGLDHCIRLTPYILDHTEQKHWLEQLSTEVMAAENPPVIGLFADTWRAWASNSQTPEDILTATEVAESLLTLPAGKHPLVLWSAALGRDALGEPEAAAPYYREFLALEPGAYSMHNNFALLLLSVEGSEAEALEHANIAVKLAQTAQITPLKLRSYLDTQAQALLANARAEEAVTIYVRALEPEPTWPTGILGYAEALEAAGQPEQAREALKALDPSEMTGEQTARAETIRSSLEN